MLVLGFSQKKKQNIKKKKNTYVDLINQNWLMVSTPPEKYEFVSWGYYSQ